MPRNNTGGQQKLSNNSQRCLLQCIFTDMATGSFPFPFNVLHVLFFILSGLKGTSGSKEAGHSYAWYHCFRNNCTTLWKIPRSEKSFSSFSYALTSSILWDISNLWCHTGHWYPSQVSGNIQNQVCLFLVEIWNFLNNISFSRRLKQGFLAWGLLEQKTVLWRPIEKIFTLLGGINDVRLLHFSSVYTQKLGPWIGPHQHVFCASRLGEFLLQECFSSSIYSQYLQLALTGTLAAFIRLPHPPLPHVNSSITPPASLRMWPHSQTAQLSTSQEVPSRLLLW